MPSGTFASLLSGTRKSYLLNILRGDTNMVKLKISVCISYELAHTAVLVHIALISMKRASLNIVTNHCDVLGFLLYSLSASACIVRAIRRPLFGLCFTYPAKRVRLLYLTRQAFSFTTSSPLRLHSRNKLSLHVYCALRIWLSICSQTAAMYP